MTDSKYPSELDSDVELPRVDDNISEIGGDAINGLRSAVFNIEETLGINPQGTLSDVDTRISVSMNEDGTLKASALSAIGLITLPITDSMISATAAIEETKLALNYTTSTLKTWIDQNRVNIVHNTNRLNIDILNLANHVSHPSAWGTHYTMDIDGYSGTQYDGYNLQGIVSNLDSRIVAHIGDLVGAHAASAISFDDTDTVISAENVQTAIEAIDKMTQGAVIIHQDNQHSSGVLKGQKVFYNDTTHSYPITASGPLYTVSVGASSVQFVSKPTGFDDIKRGDRIDITISSSVYSYYVNSIISGSAIVNFFGVVPVSGASATAIVYNNQEETIAPSSLNFGIRQYNVSDTGGSIIQLVHPGSPFILSSGIDVRGLTASVYNIAIKWADSQTVDIDIYTAMQTFNALPSTWTVENLAIVLNQFFRGDSPAYHYPLVAFTYKGELGIAYDRPTGYVQIIAPSSNSAWSVLGFSETDISYALDRKFYVDGYAFTGVRKYVDSTAAVDAGDTNVIASIVGNLKAAGVKASGLIRVEDSTGDDGTYLFTQVNDTTSVTVDEHSFTPDSSINIEIYSDAFCVPVPPSRRTLYELFIDGYNGEEAEFRGTERVQYYNGSGSPQDLSSVFDIVDVSRNFSEGLRRIIYTITGTTITMALGTRGSGLTLAQSGPAVTLPTPSTSILGYSFRLVDYDGVNYLDLEAIANYTILSTGNGLDVNILDRPNEEHYLQVGKVLHNKTGFKHLADRRLFGTVGRKDVRDDFTRDNTSYPRSVLRGNGINYGFVLENTSTTVTINGGECLVNGFLYGVDKKTFNVPEDSVAGNYNIFVDTNGVLQFLRDDQFVENVISAPSVSEIIASSDKTMLWQVTVNAGNSITATADFRRFINKLDNKIELVVEENDITHGSFASLKAASNYLSNSNSASTRVIKIHGEATYNLADGIITLPNNVIIQGDAGNYGSSDLGSILSVSGTGTSFITAGTGNVFRNLNFVIEDSASMNVFIGSSSSNVDSLIFENCLFTVGDSVSIDTLIGTDSGYFQNFNIKDCKFVIGDTFTGVNLIGAFGNLTNGIIENCIFTGVNSSNSYINVVGSLAAYPGGIINVNITNCDITFDDEATNNNAIYAAGSVWNCLVSDCEFTFTSLTGINYGIFGSYIQESMFFNNKFTFPEVTSGSSKGFYGTTYITGCYIINNVLDCTDETVNNVAILTPTMDSNIISNNKFDYFYTTISTTTACVDTSISNNLISNTGIYGLVLVGSSGTNINKNIIFSNAITSSSACLIKLDDVELTNIFNNYLYTTSSNIPNGNMLRVLTSSFKISIMGNYFQNSIGVNIGFLTAIYFEVPSTSNTNVLISNNIISNFSGDGAVAVPIYSFKGMSLYNISVLSIVNNIVLNSTYPMYLYNCAYELIICNNYLLSGGGYSVSHNAENCVVKIDGNSSKYYLGLVFCDNILYHYSNTADPYTQIMEITSGSSSIGQGIISNNLFYLNSSTFASAYAMLKTAAKNFVISGNSFVTTSVVFSSESPLTSSGNNCYVALNMLSSLTATAPTAGAVNVTGTASIDFMNKGGTYHVTIPLSRAQTVSGTNWVRYLGSAPYAFSFNNSGTLGDKAGIEFNTADVPNGALLKTIEFYLDANNNLDIAVRKSNWNEASTSGDFLITTTHISETTMTEKSLSFPSDTYMEDNSAYFIYLLVGSAAAAVYLEGVYITYEL